MPDDMKAHTAPRMPDLGALQPLCRLATCNGLIQLKSRYPQYCYFERDTPNSNGWGLKQMGTLLCADRIVRSHPARVLEVGAGTNRYFDEWFGSLIEYWMIDDAGFYDTTAFQAACAKRRHTRHVQGLLGSSSSEIPDASFNMVFSISVLEHVPAPQRLAVYKDMFRILAPGGQAVHSIDLSDPESAKAHRQCLLEAGFDVPRTSDMIPCVMDLQAGPTLFEPLYLVFHDYFGKTRPDMWTNLRSVTCQYFTLLVAARRPS